MARLECSPRSAIGHARGPGLRALDEKRARVSAIRNDPEKVPARRLSGDRHPQELLQPRAPLPSVDGRGARRADLDEPAAPLRGEGLLSGDLRKERPSLDPAAGLEPLIAPSL